MAGNKTKIVDHIDQETNHKTRVLLPVDTPIEYAAEGVPISIDLSGLYPEPLCHQLEQALWERGLISPADFNIPGALTAIRQAVQQVAKMDANDIYQYVKTRSNAT